MIKNIAYANTSITGGFWKNKQDMVRNTTVHAVYDRFAESGRFEAFRFLWQEGMEKQPHFYWESDVAKWIEGVAYLTKETREPRLEAIVDALVDEIEAHMGDDGYFNIYFTVVAPNDRFSDRDKHELYCAGHLIEAAVAYYEATGKRKFLDLMCRYADYIEKRFVIDSDTPFRTPGHEEIELALVCLYRCVGDERYLALAKHFIDMRGTAADRTPGDTSGKIDLYWQAHKPVRKQTEAVGHAVRAVYLYAGMADIAYHTADADLLSACKVLFDDIVDHKMYITGGIGSSSQGEAFTKPYDLTNLFAYTETCAALGLALFANRMQALCVDGRYGDVIERIIYNGFMSSTSLDGKAFFYENPLEILPQFKRRNENSRWPRTIQVPMMERAEAFDCSCCPPNIVRLIPSIARFLYSDDGETVYVHQFMQSETTVTRGNVELKLSQKTAYPENGRVRITVRGGDTRLAVRIPAWCDDYRGETENGYAYFDVKDGETLSFDFKMKVKLIEARPEAIFNCGRYAVTRGPIVYCMESADNGDHIRDIRIDGRARFTYGEHPTLHVPMLTVKAYRRAYDENAPLYRERERTLVQTEARLIPYYAFANRGAAEMQVWHLVK